MAFTVSTEDESLDSLKNLYEEPNCPVGHKIRVNALALFLVVTSIDAQTDEMEKFQASIINTPTIEKIVDSDYFSNSLMPSIDVTINQTVYKVLVSENLRPWQRRETKRKLYNSFYDNFDEIQTDIDHFLPLFKEMTKELSRLQIMEVFVDVSRNNNMIDFNLNLQEDIFLSVAKMVEEKSMNVMFSIARNHKTLVIDEMPLPDLIQKVVNVVAQLKTFA